MTEPKAQSDGDVKMVGWVAFDDKKALLRRVAIPGGARGLLLRTAESALGQEVRQKALEFGFSELKTPGVLRMLFPTGKIPFSPRVLAEGLGGRVIAISRSEMLSPRWTVNLSRHAPNLGESSRAKGAQPDPETITSIGLNIRGEEVVRDNKGRFYRKVSQDGEQSYVDERDGEQHTLFLRARRVEDLDAIASSLLVMASKGRFQRQDFERVIGAALEEGPHGHLEMPQGEAESLVRRSMLREIAEISVGEKALREDFLRAIKLSAGAGIVLSQPAPENGQLAPSPAMLSFLRRLTRGHVAVDFRGSDDLSLGMPRVQRDGADLQVHDLGDVSVDGLVPFIGNIISRRSAEGSSVFRVPADLNEEALERVRFELGSQYALEGVVEVASAVANGRQDGEGSIFFFVGERRPEPLEALPQAALRTFRVLTLEDLLPAEREIVRARARIREFHEGVSADEVDAADDREENARQRPYQPLSQINDPFTMIPVALEGATNKALERARRHLENRGGVDAVVGAALGVSHEALKEIATAEQVDAMALQMVAEERGRGFLLADQTGVGKGRSLAAMARAHVRSRAGNRVLYFTESATINVPDVCRDLRDVGAIDEMKIMFLTSGSHFVDLTVDRNSGEETRREIKSLTAAQRNAVLAGGWPDGYDTIITTYSSFRGDEESPGPLWLQNALDDHVKVILDEAHNALNPTSRQGRNVRVAMRAVGPANVIFGTATPMKEPKGMSLYAPLLPQGSVSMQSLLDDMVRGGEVAQEAFATMLAEDGVLLRRDHDLSNIEFMIALPDDETMLRYQEVMNRFSPIVEAMIEASGAIGTHMGRHQARIFADLRARGLSEEASRTRTNELNQYSIALGSPLSNLARITMNALKINQVVDQAMKEIEEGRKPLITFHSTNAALLQELAKGEDGKISEEAMAEARDLTLKDQIRRIHRSIYRVKMDGEHVDARTIYPGLNETADLVEQLIDELPDDLPVSPVDALVERLEENGVSVGEITGRSLCYRDGRIQRRQGRNRKEAIDAFNSGELDALIYNSAGATGGSYHASAQFRDQRPRTMLEMEAPTDVIKYVQSQGRGNRYGQVARPRITSVVTGLIPEMRILQQRNRKLRSLGASVDGNRAHPLLLDDVPDLLNKVGDEATYNVLVSMPALANRLGFTDLAQESVESAANTDRDTGSGTTTNGIESLANKVLVRSLVLSATEQDSLIQRIRMEFDALIEELDSRNANPLKPKQLGGQIDVRATSLFSGIETEDGDLDTSSFLSPLYLSTAVHHFTEEAWSADRLVRAVENSRRLNGADGFASFAERLRQNMPTILQGHLPEGLSLEEAMENPAAATISFRNTRRRLLDLIAGLEQIRPGVAFQWGGGAWDPERENYTVTGLIPPTSSSFIDMASAYKVKVILPGVQNEAKFSMAYILLNGIEDVRFAPGLSEGFDEAYLADFERAAVMERRMPVQILSGNVLRAISEARSHNLGTISLYRDKTGQVHRGIVVTKDKVDLARLPVPLPNARVSGELAYRFLNDQMGEDAGFVKFWGSMSPDATPGSRNEEAEDEADIILLLSKQGMRVNLLPLKKLTYEFYAERPGLYEAIWEEAMPEQKDVKARKKRVHEGGKGSTVARLKFSSPGHRERALRIIELIGDVPMLTDGHHRAAVNEITGIVERLEGRQNLADADVIEGQGQEVAVEVREIPESQAAGLVGDMGAEPALADEAAVENFDNIVWG